MSAEVKSQHYVHRAYLEGFCDPHLASEGKSTLWMYMPGKSPFPQRPERVAKRNYYYCFQDEDRRQFHAEHALQKVEDLALPILRRVRECDLKLSPEDRLLFSAYIGLSHTRVPAFERIVDRIATVISAKDLESVAADRGELERVVKKLSEKTGEAIDPEDYLRKLTGGSVVVTQTNRAGSIGQMFMAVEKLQYLISKMRWTLLLGPLDDPGFLTSDNPVSLFDPAASDEAIGFASSPAAHFTFALSKNVCLRGQHTNAPRVLKLNSSQVREVNSNTVKCADSQVYAPFKSQPIQRILDKTVASRKKPGRVLFSKGRLIQE
jgi:hypothetical protein